MDFSYCLTKDIQLPVSVRIATLEGKHRLKSTERQVDKTRVSTYTLNSPLPDVYVTVQLYGDNKPLTVPVKTSYKAFKNHWSWNEWLTLPIRYCDLPASAQLAITVWDAIGPRKTKPIGGTTFQLFGKQCTLRKGKHKLHLWPDCEADGSRDTTTPSKIKQDQDSDMNKLEKLVKRYDCGDIRPEEWLDVMAFRQIESIHKTLSAASTALALYIDLPKFDFPVVYGEMEYDLPGPFSSTGQTVGETAMKAAMNQQIYAMDQRDTMPQRTATQYVLVLDTDLQRDNPVEAKHRRLVRSHRN
ncbi:Phosphatidylinositol (PI) 3-kinase, partial [Rhizopus stolonifer]